MDEGHLRVRRVLRLAIVLLTAMTSACTAQGLAGLRVWIDVPTGGARVGVGQTVNVRSHAYASEGVAEAMLVVNSVPYRRDPPSRPGATFTDITQVWVAGQPGEYLLEVVAYDTRGDASSPASIWLSVDAEVTATPTPSPEPTSTATPTVTPSPQVQATFWTERTSLASGECTQLHWETDNATAVSIDGASVALQGAQEVCPLGTITYHLLATAPGGSVEQSVTVAVTAPPDTEGPSITDGAPSPGVIWDGSACGPTVATISARVTDPSGVSGVELHYRVVRGSEQGQWRVLSLSPAGGDTYRTSLGPTELSASLSLYGGGVVEYFVRARDSAGNDSQSGTLSFEARLCFG